MALASRSKRAFRSGLEERCCGKTLIATSRPSRVSRARYTSPIPPAPSGPEISYGPSREPGSRRIVCQENIASSVRAAKCALQIDVLDAGGPVLECLAVRLARL